MVGRQSADDPLSRVPLFAEMSRRELAAIRRLSTPLKTQRAGKVLIQQGEPGAEFFIIVEGEALVTIDGKKVAKLGPGDFFGEMALLNRGPRTATVTCATDLQVEVISRRDFSLLLEDSPTLTRKILSSMASRVREADSRMAH
jgi:CRP/FNR family cyclic AMP-dependent transcriptional regulator